MNNCLNCEKPVNNKYCNTTCQNNHRKLINEQKYYLNPKKCNTCDIILPFNIKNNKYCNSSCSAKTNNIGRPSSNRPIYENIDDNQFILFFLESKSKYDFYKKIGYKNKVNSLVRNEIINRLEKLGFDFNDLNIIININDNTKGELFSKHKSWQSARGCIQKTARKIYFLSKKEKYCSICGYSKHIEVAHKIPVASFSNDVLISEINDIDNLIGLCRNHHWEYDNGYL